jgi:hypothetical protein
LSPADYARLRLKAERQGWEVPSPVGKATEVCGRVEAHGAIGLADRDEQSMLVDQVKVVDKPDELALAAQVRLKVAERLRSCLDAPGIRPFTKDRSSAGLGTRS